MGSKPTEEVRRRAVTDVDQFVTEALAQCGKAVPVAFEDCDERALRVEFGEQPPGQLGKQNPGRLRVDIDLELADGVELRDRAADGFKVLSDGFFLQCGLAGEVACTALPVAAGDLQNAQCRPLESR